MKLKGQLTDNGARLLWKSFLPTLEKFGKTCQLLLGPDEVYLIQTSLNTDGVHSTAKLASDTLFEPGSYRCQSKHHDLIAFTADVGLLLRVLKGAAANAADSVEVKLTIRQVADAAGAATNKPFLCFTATGPSLHVVQDVPISKPYNMAELEQLVAAKDVGPYCPSYCDLGPELGAAQAIADRLKALHDTALLAVSKTGDAHLLVQTPSVTLGAQLRDLPVYPTSAYVADGVDRSKPVNEQLQGALEDGTAAGAYVALKQLARVLHATPLSEPSQVLCGELLPTPQGHESARAANQRHAVRLDTQRLYLFNTRSARTCTSGRCIWYGVTHSYDPLATVAAR